MNEQVHIIITGDRGKTFRLPCTRKKLRIIIISSIVTLAVLSAASIYSISLFAKNQRYSRQLADLQHQLKTTVALIAEQQRKSDEKQAKLSQQVARLEQNNVTQAKAFRGEKENILTNTISELKERSELIGQFISSIGIKHARIASQGYKNSGGPFVQETPNTNTDLLNRADKYISTLRFLPMGRPVSGPISSRFGSRSDPINGKSAFHTGLDFRAKRGEKVHATADGVVRKAYRNGGYGNFVEICHSNGYCSSFAHLQKYMVEAGDKVTRGQIIGFVGNSGRSTGAHLHYEVTLNNKPVNPYQLMKVANSYNKKRNKTKKRK